MTRPYPAMPVSLLLAAGLTSFAAVCDGAEGTYAHAMQRPIEWKDVHIERGLLQSARERSERVGLADYLAKFEQHGLVENFRIAAEGRKERHRGWANNNEFVFKHLEALAWFAPNSAPAEAMFHELQEVVLAAQEEDGYLNTFYQNPIQQRRGAKRFAATNRFELYNFGHLTQAGIARFVASGEQRLLNASIRFADLLVESFGEPNDLPYDLYQGPVNKKYEHPNHELAMVELYRVTGDRRYLRFVRQTLEEYGYFGEQFEEIWGHAVQETLLNAGAADLYLETGDEDIWEVVQRLWEDMHDRKMYVTGGVGSTNRGEAYGRAFELPNDTAYSETCAAISLFLWNHKMLLATADAKYADEMERSLFNNILAGYSLDGKRYFYPNPLAWDPADRKRAGRRSPWFGTSCCPPNIHRLLGSLNRYVFTKHDSGVCVNLYIPSRMDTTLPNEQQWALSVETHYPSKGEVVVTVEKAPHGTVGLSLRVPRWSLNPLTHLNGERTEVTQSDGYLVMRRQWRAGDQVRLELMMEPRLIEGNPQVNSQKGRVAIARGPLVYCVEQSDNPGVDLSRVLIPKSALLRTIGSAEDLAGVRKIEVSAATSESHSRVAITAIPYFVWANREAGKMLVWIPVKR